MQSINLLPERGPSRLFNVMKYTVLVILIIIALVMFAAWFIFMGRIVPQHVPSQDVTLTFQTVGEDVFAACEDFESPRVEDKRITVCLGRRDTGGYQVAVSKVVDVGPYIQVHATETRPGTCQVIQTVTSPAVTIELNEAPGKEVKVNMIERDNTDCGDQAPDPVDLTPTELR